LSILLFLEEIQLQLGYNFPRQYSAIPVFLGGQLLLLFISHNNNFVPIGLFQLSSRLGLDMTLTTNECPEFGWYDVNIIPIYSALRTNALLYDKIRLWSQYCWGTW